METLSDEHQGVYSPSNSSQPDESQRHMVVEEFEEPVLQVSEIVEANAETNDCSYEEFRKTCFKQFLLKELTYCKLKRLMELFQAEMAEKMPLHHRRSLSSWKAARLLYKTMSMFHFMFEEVKEDITLSSIYYQRMSDLLSLYIDNELKASEVSSENAVIISSRITYVMETYLDKQHRFTLDTLLKSNFICNKFQEISKLVISRIVRGLPSTEYSEQAFIRSMLVFKLWIQITKDVEERTKILKLASHLAKPPKELLKEPSKLTKDILPCNLQKCYIDLASYIIGTPWPFRKKIKIFLERTRILETQLPNESISETPDSPEVHKNEEMSDIMALKEILSDLQEIIIVEEKNQQIINALKNNHYKYPSFDELDELRNKNASSQTPSEQNEELPLLYSKVIKDCMHELSRRIANQINSSDEFQIQGRENICDKILSEVSISDLANSIRNIEFSQDSVPREMANSLNFDSILADTCNEKPVETVNPNIQNCEAGNKRKKNVRRKSLNESVSTISVRPSDSISNNYNNITSQEIADWHTPEIHYLPNVSFGPSFLPSNIMQMTSGLMKKGPTEISPTDAELPVVTSSLPLPQGSQSGIDCGQSSPFANLVRSTESLLPTNSSLITAPLAYQEKNINSSANTLLNNRQAYLRSRYDAVSNPSFREDSILVKDTTVKYYPPGSKNNSIGGPFNLGINSFPYQKEQNVPMQPHQMLYNQYHNRPPYSLANEAFSFYDDETIANSGPQVRGPHINVQPPYSLPINLPTDKKVGATQSSQTRRRGRGARNNSTVRRSNKKQSSEKPANITVNTDSTPDNHTLQNWPSQEYINQLRTLDYTLIPNSNSQMMFRPVSVSTIQNHPDLPYTRLPPYSSIRRKNNGFDPSSSATSTPVTSSSTSLPIKNTTLADSVTSLQPFSPGINNIMNTPSQTINVAPCGSIIHASTSFSVPRMHETNLSVMNSNCYRTIMDPICSSLELFPKFLNIALQKATSLLTRKNDLGFLEYNFDKMPIPLQAFKDALSCIDKINSNYKTTDTIDGVVELLSQTNEHFSNQKNMFPPQLLKVNNNDTNRSKFDISQDQRKSHENTLYSDNLTFVYQEKIRNFYSECSDLSQDDLIFKSDLETRCYCLQCCANRLVLDLNYIILRHFRNYQISKLTEHRKENKINRSMSKPCIPKRSFEKITEEKDSPLPLKKRITSTPPGETSFGKVSEVSYPPTPMISIAELELFKDFPTSIIEHKNDLVGIANSNSSTIPESIAEPSATEISKNICTNNSVQEMAAYHILENNGVRTMTNDRTNNNDIDKFLDIAAFPNDSSSELIQTSVAEQSIKIIKRNTNKRLPGRPRKNVKKC